MPRTPRIICENRKTVNNKNLVSLPAQLLLFGPIEGHKWFLWAPGTYNYQSTAVFENLGDYFCFRANSFMMRYIYRCCCGGLGGMVWKDVLLDVQSIVLGVPANLNDVTDEPNVTDVRHVHMGQYKNVHI